MTIRYQLIYKPTRTIMAEWSWLEPEWLKLDGREWETKDTFTGDVIEHEEHEEQQEES